MRKIREKEKEKVRENLSGYSPIALFTNSVLCYTLTALPSWLTTHLPPPPLSSAPVGGGLAPSVSKPLSVELGGFVGNLGTYIPIVLTLTLVNHLDFSTTLIFTALYNISTDFLFSIPMPIQPMKSIATVAISEPLLSLPQIVVAGLSIAATLFIFGTTGLMSLLYRFIPLPIVRGVQLS
uniref:Molybdate transporter 2 n=1 Tax=Vitis vinifera TaxID=29760 RepID=F6HSS9_VITVI